MRPWEYEEVASSWGPGGVTPEWQFGGGVTIGDDGNPVITFGGGVGSAGSCPTCQQAQAVGNLSSSLPLIIVLVIVAVLALR